MAGARLTFTRVDDRVARLGVVRSDESPIGASTPGMETRVGPRRLPLFGLDGRAGPGSGALAAWRVRVWADDVWFVQDQPELPWEVAAPLLEWARESDAAVRSAPLGMLPEGDHLLVRCPRPAPAEVPQQLSLLHDLRFGPGRRALFARAARSQDAQPRADQPLIGCAVLWELPLVAVARAMGWPYASGMTGTVVEVDGWGTIQLDRDADTVLVVPGIASRRDGDPRPRPAVQPSRRTSPGSQCGTSR